MLVIRIEVWPKGIERYKKKIGEAIILNDNSGTCEKGNYLVEFHHEGKPLRGKVRGFKRQERRCWELVFEALQEVYGPCAITMQKTEVPEKIITASVKEIKPGEPPMYGDVAIG